MPFVTLQARPNITLGTEGSDTVGMFFSKAETNERDAVKRQRVQYTPPDRRLEPVAMLVATVSRIACEAAAAAVHAVRMAGECDLALQCEMATGACPLSSHPPPVS